MTEVFQETIQSLLYKAAKNGGYPKDESQRMFGNVRPFEKVLAMLPAETLLFAAHPFQIAQPPPAGKWEIVNLYNSRLTGYEFWNSRTRSRSLTLNPFAHQEWKDPDKLIENDQKRIEKVKAWADCEWDLALRRGLANWAAADVLPSLRPVFLAGTDAHGSFNYGPQNRVANRRHGDWASCSTALRPKRASRAAASASDRPRARSVADACNAGSGITALKLI